MTLVIDDKTKSGKQVKIHDLGEDGWEVWVNGEYALVTGTSIYRDGGTRRIWTSRGIVTLPNKMGSVDRVPKLDGEDIGPVPPEVTAERQRRAQALHEIARRESGLQ